MFSTHIGDLGIRVFLIRLMDAPSLELTPNLAVTSSPSLSASLSSLALALVFLRAESLFRTFAACAVSMG